MNQSEPPKLTTDPSVPNTGFSQYLPPPDDEFSVEEQTYYKGWECDFQGFEDERGKWSSTLQTDEKTKKRTF